MKNEKYDKWLSWWLKSTYLLPATIFSFLILYDYATIFRLGLYTISEVYFSLYLEMIWFILAWYFSLKCLKLHNDIINIWEENWKRIEGENSSVITLEKDLVKEFGNDEAVNNALRKLRV